FTCLLALEAQAAEWRIDPSIRLRTGYNDNITLTSGDNEAASSEITLKPSVKFSRNTANSSLSGTVGLNLRRFPDESGLDDDNANLRLSATKSLEHHDFGLDVDFIKDTTLDTELDETGLVFGRTDRTRQSLRPNWSWRFSERTNASLSYTYNDVDYDDNNNGYVDYLSHSGQLSLNRSLNERAIGSLIVSQTLTDSDNDVLSRVTNLQAGVRYQFSESVSGTLFAGARRTTTKFSRVFFVSNTIPIPVTTKVDDDGTVFSGSLTKKTERGSHGITLSRDVSSSVSGRLIEVTRAGLSNDYRFSERLRGTLGVNFYNSKSTSDASTINNLDREYYTISPGLHWKLSQFWAASVDYRYKKQINEGNSNDAVQNAFYLNLTYNWPRFAWSR
ncbi:MAG: hypothetical protein V3W04_08530, partial [Gammaproteobacteria bacterium]